MTTIGIPTTMPIPMPWPTPRPGVGTPSPGVGTITNPGNVTTNPVVSPAGGGLTGPFANLFAFSPDWKLWGALILVALSVEVLDQTYPEYVWVYVGILFLALMIKLAGFTPQLDRWLGR